MKNMPIFNYNLNEINAIQIAIEPTKVDGEEVYCFYLFLTNGEKVKVETTKTTDEIVIQKQFATIKTLIKDERLYYIKPVMLINYEFIKDVVISPLKDAKTGKVSKKKAVVTITFNNGVVIKRAEKQPGKFANFLLSRGIPTTLKGYQKQAIKLASREFFEAYEQERTEKLAAVSEEGKKQKAIMKKDNKALRQIQKEIRRALREEKRKQRKNKKGASCVETPTEEAAPTC